MTASWEPFGAARREADAMDGGTEASAPPTATLPARPARELAVLTCMDCRLEPIADLGLARGDAVVMRNGGAMVTEDVLRSLELAVVNLGVTEALLLGHTGCAAHGGDVEAVREALREGLATLASALPQIRARAGVYSMADGAVEPIS